MIGASATSVRKSGPTLRALGNTYSTGQPQGNQTIQIPSSAQVGDYLVIAGNNGFNWVGNVIPEGWKPFYGSQSTGTTYFENCVIYVKICEAGDIGSSHVMQSGGYNFQVAVYVFTNPNKTFIGKASGSLYWFYAYQTAAAQTSILSGNITSFTYPQFPKKLPPGSLTFGIYASNGESGYPNMSYSGPGTNRYVQDPYWWRGTGFFYKENTDGLITNHTVTNQGQSFAWLQIYLV